MRCNIPSVNCALRIARALNDPYGSNELNLPLADRYNAGVLDMTAPRHMPAFSMDLTDREPGTGPTYRVLFSPGLCLRAWNIS